MTTWVCVSVPEARVASMVEAGPRRDFLELAARTGGTLIYSEATTAGKGWRARILGPHVRQAWRAAGLAGEGDVLFADGEHVGVPLALFLRLRRRRARVVMLGHFVSKPWKRASLAVASRLGAPGCLVVHSVLQRDSVRQVLGRGWTSHLVPYQVDTAFWRRTAVAGGASVLAVGAESRDYATLVEAVRGLGIDTRVAAGSHWARKGAGDGAAADAGVTWISEPLPFRELREAYASAMCVVVPLHDVPNQSGVTTVLEAMSMGLPVVVTATRGQREVVRGPLVTASGIDPAAAADRGPSAFGGSPAADDDSGLYVPVGDSAALARALGMLRADPAMCEAMGRAGRRAAEAHFSLEAYITALADIVAGEAAAGSRAQPVAVTA